MTWTRRGECNHCGWCCQFMGAVRVNLSALDAETERFLGYRTMVREIVVPIPAPCVKHVEDRCAIYDTRPAACQSFPTKPEQIERTPCSYWFEDGEVRRGGDASPFGLR